MRSGRAQAENRLRLLRGNCVNKSNDPVVEQPRMTRAGRTETTTYNLALEFD
jgi:hypothetical protein